MTDEGLLITGQEQPVRRLRFLAWACAALLAIVATSGLSGTTDDARVLVSILSIVLPGCAAGAGFALAKGHAALAGFLLVISVATPTWAAWPVSLLPLLLVGAVARDARALRHER